MQICHWLVHFWHVYVVVGIFCSFLVIFGAFMAILVHSCYACLLCMSSVSRASPSLLCAASMNVPEAHCTFNSPTEFCELLQCISQFAAPFIIAQAETSMVWCAQSDSLSPLSAHPHLSLSLSVSLSVSPSLPPSLLTSSLPPSLPALLSPPPSSHLPSSSPSLSPSLPNPSQHHTSQATYRCDACGARTTASRLAALCSPVHTF